MSDRLREALDEALATLSPDELHYEYANGPAGPSDPELFVPYERIRAALAAAPVLDEPAIDEALALGEAGVVEDADHGQRIVDDLHAAGYRILRATPPSTEPTRRRHDPTDHDCRGGAPGDRFPF